MQYTSILSYLLISILGGMGAAACSSEDGEGRGGGPWENGDDQEITDGFKPGCTAKKVAPYALGGTLLLPDGAKEGFVVVRDEKIESIVDARTKIPADVKNVVETKAIISPGFIDLHNHVAYNFLPLWVSGRRF